MLEQILDRRIIARLRTDGAYRNAKNAEEQQQREDEIAAEEERRLERELLETARRMTEEHPSRRAELVDELETIAGSHAEEEAQRLELEEMQRAELVDMLAGDVALPAVDSEAAELERARLAEELEQQDRENVTTAARDTLAAIEELGQLRRLADLLPRFLVAQANQSRLRAERMAGRPGVPAHKLEHARQEAAELAEALEIARRWSPLRRSILAKALPNG